MTHQRGTNSAKRAIVSTNSAIDGLLDTWHSALGADFEGYRNHVYRVFNLAVAMAEPTDEDREKLAIAAVFHDVGIWLDGTWDYLEPSARRATEYLTNTGHTDWINTIHLVIEQHHRIRRWHGPDTNLVESFRRADWLDVCLFALPSQIERAYLSELLRQFPRGNFHRRLVVLTLDWMRTHPLNPLPVLKW